MPELPEVETVRKQLEKKLTNKTIVSVDVKVNNIIEYPTVSVFKKNIKNQTIREVKRRGKWLLFRLDDYYLLSHLRMEGKFEVLKKRNDSKHTHVIFEFDKGQVLNYNDVRKFGKMALIPLGKINTYQAISKLGLEPFSSNLTVQYLKDKYKNKTIAIKTCLLDQTIISGIGNIYADEILFASKINPYRSAKTLTAKELELLIKNTRTILKKAIQNNGTTIRSYVSVDGKEGTNQNELLVYQREGEPCLICGAPIQKSKVNQRGTHYCLKCQK